MSVLYGVFCASQSRWINGKASWLTNTMWNSGVKVPRLFKVGYYVFPMCFRVFLPRAATQSRAWLCHSQSAVRLSVRPSVSDVQVPCSHRPRLEYFENNFTPNSLRCRLGAHPSSTSVQHRRSEPTGTPQNSGGMGVGSWAQKLAISLQSCKIEPRLLRQTNRSRIRAFDWYQN